MVLEMGWLTAFTICLSGLARATTRTPRIHPAGLILTHGFLHIMSADLFAAFGSTPTQQQQSSNTAQPKAQPAPSFSFFDDLASPAPTPATQTQTQQLHATQSAQTTASEADDNDDWGEFEGGSSVEPASVKHDPFAFGSTTSHASQSLQSSWQPAPIYKAKKSYDSNVLFDAEDDAGDDDDDFGDFEDPTSNSPSAPAPARSSGVADLLGDLTISQPKPMVTDQQERTNTRSNIPTSPTAKRNQAGAFGSVSRPKQPSTVSKGSTAKQKDSWDSFDDWEASIPTKVPAKASKKPNQSTETPASVSQPAISSPTLDEPQPGELPPTNVPPPGVLLALFPPLFADAQDKLFKPMAAQTLPMRNKLLSELATITYLQGYLALASVAARIIAGRKLRWKRDQYLSQGMRIGPASSRATSGMKLTGIDKSENMKEEREASDVVRAWREQIGRLRHVVSAVNQAKAGSLGAVPDLQETLPVKMLKQAEGGVPAPQPCMLCGLKRDERVTAADQAVEDSFGEWWVDQVSMHRGAPLPQRFSLFLLRAF